MNKFGASATHLMMTDSIAQIWQGLKEYSKWPTFPQLYANGELVGGCDIIVELSETGELSAELGIDAVQESTVDLNTRLEQLVKSQNVMLFMKGEPNAPRCGFSSRVIEMLRAASVEFGHFDILQVSKALAHSCPCRNMKRLVRFFEARPVAHPVHLFLKTQNPWHLKCVPLASVGNAGCTQ